MASRINLDKLTDAELQTLRAEIVTKVAERLKLDPGSNVMYDRHSSGHSNSTSAFKDVELLTNPGRTRG